MKFCDSRRFCSWLANPCHDLSSAKSHTDPCPLIPGLPWTRFGRESNPLIRWRRCCSQNIVALADEGGKKEAKDACLAAVVIARSPAFVYLFACFFLLLSSNSSSVFQSDSALFDDRGMLAERNRRCKESLTALRSGDRSRVR